jgi:hypothetical protein
LSTRRAYIRKPFTVKDLLEKIGTRVAEKLEQAKKGASGGVSQGVPKGAPEGIIF